MSTTKQIDNSQLNKDIKPIFHTEVKDDRMFVYADFGKTKYTGSIPKNPWFSFEDLSQQIASNNFTGFKLDKQFYSFKIAGIIPLQMKSESKMLYDDVQQNIKQLTQKINQQTKRNDDLQKIVKQLQLEIRKHQFKFQEHDRLMTQLKLQINDLLNKQTIHESLTQTRFGDQMQIIQAQTKRIDKNSSAIAQGAKNHGQLRNQLFELNGASDQTKIELKQTNQESAQTIAKLTAQITELKTEFDLLMTQTIPKCVTYEPGFLENSQVVCFSDERSNIRNFFGKKTIKNSKLLYRASHHQFCIKKFHQRCDGIPNTLTVITTEFNKKIGGFTPLKWKSSNHEWWTDNQKESFIFSLSHNDKFTLRQPEKAIYNHQNCGPIFGGGCDLSVSDKSNSKNNSQANICLSYHNQKYDVNDKESWQRFTGGTGSYNFNTVEWQVWELQFS